MPTDWQQQSLKVANNLISGIASGKLSRGNRVARAKLLYLLRTGLASKFSRWHPDGRPQEESGFMTGLLVVWAMIRASRGSCSEVPGPGPRLHVPLGSGALDPFEVPAFMVLREVGFGDQLIAGWAVLARLDLIESSRACLPMSAIHAPTGPRSCESPRLRRRSSPWSSFDWCFSRRCRA